MGSGAAGRGAAGQPGSGAAGQRRAIAATTGAQHLCALIRQAPCFQLIDGSVLRAKLSLIERRPPSPRCARPGRRQANAAGLPGSAHWAGGCLQRDAGAVVGVLAAKVSTDRRGQHLGIPGLVAVQLAQRGAHDPCHNGGVAWRRAAAESPRCSCGTATSAVSRERYRRLWRRLQWQSGGSGGGQPGRWAGSSGGKVGMSDGDVARQPGGRGHG